MAVTMVLSTTLKHWTDALPEFGGDTYTQTDVYMLGRTNGVATYRNTDFFGLVEGLNFALQYRGNNEDPAQAKEQPTAAMQIVVLANWPVKTATVSVCLPPTTLTSG